MNYCYTKNYYGYIVLNKKNAPKIIELLGLDTRFSSKEEVQDFVNKVGNNFHKYCRYENGELTYGSIRHKVFCYDDYGSFGDWFYEDAYEKKIPCKTYFIFDLSDKDNPPKFIRTLSPRDFKKHYTSVERIE